MRHKTIISTLSYFSPRTIIFLQSSLFLLYAFLNFYLPTCLPCVSSTQHMRLFQIPRNELSTTKQGQLVSSYILFMRFVCCLIVLQSVLVYVRCKTVRERNEIGVTQNFEQSLLTLLIKTFKMYIPIPNKRWIKIHEDEMNSILKFNYICSSLQECFFFCAKQKKFFLSLRFNLFLFLIRLLVCIFFFL